MGDYPEELPELEIEKTFPTNDATVSPDVKRIYVKFKQRLDPHYAYPLVVVSGASYIRGRSFLEDEDHVIAFYPFGSLPSGKKIVVRINKNLKGVETKPLGEEREFYFFTENK